MVVFEEGRQVAVAPRGSGSGWVGDDPGSRIESKRKRRPALRHAKEERRTRSGFYPGGLCTSSTWKRK